MIHIILSKYIADTGRISYRYIFDIENNFNIDKIISLPYGYFWKVEDRYILNIFKSGEGIVFGVGGTVDDLKIALENEEIPDCSVLTTNDNAEILIELLDAKGIKFEWYKHIEDYLKTSD